MPRGRVGDSDALVHVSGVRRAGAPAPGDISGIVHSTSPAGSSDPSVSPKFAASPMDRRSSDAGPSTSDWLPILAVVMTVGILCVCCGRALLSAICGVGGKDLVVQELG